MSDNLPTIWRPRLVATVVLALVAVSGVLGGMSLERWLEIRRFDRGGPPQGMFRGGGRPDRDRGGRGDGGSRSGGGGRGPSRMREEFARELGLSAAQQVQVDSIFATQMRQMDEIQRSSRPRADSVIERTRGAIRRVLTTEQQTMFDSLRAHQRFGQRRR